MNTLKTQKEIIQEIHYSFYNEADRLVKELIKIENNDVVDIENTHSKLIKTGFYNSKAFELISLQKDGLANIYKTKDSFGKIIDAIKYFNFKYPHYKFIPQESVYEICNKYQLLCGDAEYFIGDIPLKNMNDIIQFKVSENDLPQKLIHRSGLFEQKSYAWKIKLKKLIDKIHLRLIEMSDLGYSKESASLKNYDMFVRLEFRYNELRQLRWDDFSMKICAPITDFNMERVQRAANNMLIPKKILVPDPVVLQPVLYKDVTYYLIVTAWGDEAHDPMVHNPIHN